LPNLYAFNGLCYSYTYVSSGEVFVFSLALDGEAKLLSIWDT